MRNCKVRPGQFATVNGTAVMCRDGMRLLHKCERLYNNEVVVWLRQHENSQ